MPSTTSNDLSPAGTSAAPLPSGPAAPAPLPSRRATWAYAGALAGIVLAGAIVRWLAAQGDLWFDEIWSIALGARVTSPAGVFWQIHHDNNHYLNTLLVNAIGPGRASIAYRWPAVASGTALVGLLAVAPPLRSRAARLVAAILGAASFELIQYASEARGYAPALLFAFAAFLALDRYLASRRGAWAWAFAAASSLCVLSHLTGVLLVGASLAWAAAALWPERRTVSPAPAAVVFAGPLVVPAAIFLVDVRVMEVGGAPPWTARGVLEEAGRLAFNVTPGVTAWVLLPAAGLLAAAVVRLRRRQDPRWVFFAALVLSPGAVMLLRPEHVSSRYFLVALPFVLVLVAETATTLARASWAASVAGALLLCAYVAGGASRTAGLVAEGRGHYSEALRYMDERSGPGVIRVASDHDLRNGLLVRYYASALRTAHRIEYVDASDWTTARPDWFIVHDNLVDGPPRISPVLVSDSGAVYRLVRTYGFGGIAGWRWYLYHSP